MSYSNCSYRTPNTRTRCDLLVILCCSPLLPQPVMPCCCLPNYYYEDRKDRSTCATAMKYRNITLVMSVTPTARKAATVNAEGIMPVSKLQATAIPMHTER
mmetsp:Transcript_19432/g.54053  ORF Transcript_19432/g.54053 Transcript_19432/m.54053 type:complete len:101 (-) Transcript_19432:704-1006(-)